MIRGPQKQVNPKVAAVAIVAVLAVVQTFWWVGLLSKPKPVVTERRAGGPMGNPPPSLTGSPDAGVDTLAGSPEPGYRDGLGYAARFDSPVGIALDAKGNLLVADARNHRIRQVAPDGKVSTLAGSTQGMADGPAAQAKFDLPCGVAVAPDGAVYVADSGNHRIRRIKDGQVSTLAGSTRGLADGVGAAAKFDTPVGVALAPGGGLLVADTLNRRVRTVSFAGDVRGGWPSAGAPTGVASGPTGTATVGPGGVSLANGPALHPIPLNGFAHPVEHPVGICAAPDGWYLTDAFHCGVFLLQNGKATLLAGLCLLTPAPGWNDSSGNRARFGKLGGLVSDGKGTVYVCDTGNNAIRRVRLTGGGSDKEGEEAP